MKVLIDGVEYVPINSVVGLLVNEEEANSAFEAWYRSNRHPGSSHYKKIFFEADWRYEFDATQRAWMGWLGAWKYCAGPRSTS